MHLLEDVRCLARGRCPSVGSQSQKTCAVASIVQSPFGGGDFSDLYHVQFPVLFRLLQVGRTAHCDRVRMHRLHGHSQSAEVRAPEPEAGRYEGAHAGVSEEDLCDEVTKYIRNRAMGNSIFHPHRSHSAAVHDLCERRGKIMRVSEAVCRFKVFIH